MKKQKTPYFATVVIALLCFIIGIFAGSLITYRHFWVSGVEKDMGEIRIKIKKAELDREKIDSLLDAMNEWKSEVIGLAIYNQAAKAEK